MQRKINDTVICLRMGKTNTAKTPPGDFKVTTPEISLLSKQAVTSKRIPVPYSNLQLNPYPNTQLDLFCSDNLSFQCTALRTWLTNWYTNPSTWLTINLRRILAAKFFNLSTRWKSWNSLVIKPYSILMQQLLQERDELGQILSPVIICLNKTFASSFINWDGP